MYVFCWHIKRKRWFKIHGVNNFKFPFSNFSFLCLLPNQMGIEFKSLKILIFRILLWKVQLLKISGRIPHFIWLMSRKQGCVSGERTCIVYNPWLPWHIQQFHQLPVKPAGWINLFIVLNSRTQKVRAVPPPPPICVPFKPLTSRA